jgi:hypothetical protein
MEDARLQLLIDRAEISDVQLRYATGLDSRDWMLFRSCFADDIETDFTSVFGGEPRKVSRPMDRGGAPLAQRPQGDAAHDYESRDYNCRRRRDLHRIRAGAPLSAQRLR